MTDIDLAYKPRRWQRECHDARRRFSVFALHRRAGKTELAIMELIDRALRCKLELALYVYVAPQLKQSKSIAWARLKARLEPLRLVGRVEFNEAELSAKLRNNGATIRLFGADNPDALRGVRLDGCVIDEVAQIQPVVWDEILQPALSDRKGWALFIGTPHGVNLFSELFFRATTLPEWHSARYTVYDTASIAADEVARLQRDMSETAFAREYLCDFAASGDDQLISLTDVEAAANRVYTEKDTLDAPTILGVDPARFGSDRTVIVRRRGLQMFDPIIMVGRDNMDVAARVAAEIDEHDPDGVFIDSGAGAGVIDRLRQLDYDPVEVPFGGKAIRADQFVNRRSEMWWGMRDWIMAGGAIPKDMALRQELAVPIYWYDGTGKRVLEPKDAIKERLAGGASPDIADALALTFAYPVSKRLPREVRAVTHTGRRQRAKDADYDPYAATRERM